jgi:Fe-S-cluster containining protein
MTSPVDPKKERHGADLKDPEVLREDLEQGVRHLHAMAMETKLQFERTDAIVRALLDSLLASGAVQTEDIAQRVQEASKEARAQNRADTHVEVERAEDKYTLPGLPEVDCAGLMHLCRGRCCKLHFPLSFQDLDEHVVQWDYQRPYRIRQRKEDGYCVHSSTETHFCTVYEHRPGICRKYDCRNDHRIWIDFENKIPAPMAEIEAQPIMLYQIGLKKP